MGWGLVFERGFVVPRAPPVRSTGRSRTVLAARARQVFRARERPAVCLAAAAGRRSVLVSSFGIRAPLRRACPSVPLDRGARSLAQLARRLLPQPERIEQPENAKSCSSLDEADPPHFHPVDLRSNALMQFAVSRVDE